MSVKGDGSCHPSAPGSYVGEQPCTIELEAVASDPDGDPLTFSWRGCAAGTEPVAVCNVSAPLEFRATVSVHDGQGGIAQASGIVNGVNRAPTIRFSRLLQFPGGRGELVAPGPIPSHTTVFIAGGQPEDYDWDEDANVLCDRVKLSVSGPCHAAVAGCGGVGDVFDVDIRTTEGPGTCVLAGSVKDSWGKEGRDRLEIEVTPP